MNRHGYTEANLMADIEPTPEQIETARQLLLTNGYRVSEAPIDWKDHCLVVSIKIQSPDFTTKDFRDDVASLLAAAYDSKTKIGTRIARDIRGWSGIKVRFARAEEKPDVV